MPRRLLILGSTGSIGTQALDIVERDPELELVGLSAERSADALIAQAQAFGVDRIALADADAGARAAEAWTDGEVLVGAEGLVRLVVESGADLVLNGSSARPASVRRSRRSARASTSRSPTRSRSSSAASS